MANRTVAVKLVAEVGQYNKQMQSAAAATQGVATNAKTAGAEVGAAGGRFSRFGAAASGSLAGVSGAARGMGIGVGLGAAAAGAAMVAFAKKSVDAASDLNEQISATETLFGDAADEMIEFAKGASAIGLSTRAALEASNAFGDMFLKLGYSSDAAGTLSEDFVRMAADFASFKNLDPGEVLLKLRSGLTGEAEPLRALGIFINEAAIASEALALGLGTANGKLTESEKVTARASLIMKGMGDAYGDVARTADSYANTQRRAAAASENLKASVGQGLLPVFTDLATVAGAAGDALFQASEKAGDNWVDQIPVLGYFADGLGKLADQASGTETEIDYLTDSTEILANAENYTTEQVQEATRALEEQAKALDALLQATVAQFDSEIRYARSVNGITEALVKYDEALKANRDGKAENDVAAHDLNNTELELQQSLLDAGNAAVKQADDNAKAAGITLTESEKYEVFRSTLIALKEQFPQLSGQIDGYIGRLNAVPEAKNTKVNADTAEATRKVTDFTALINGLTGKTATVKVNPLLPPGLTGDGPGRGGGPVRARVTPVLARTGGYITSAYRTPAQNRAAGGSPRSYHLDKNNPAIDIGGPPGVLRNLYRTLAAMGGWRELLGPGDPGHSDHVHVAHMGGTVAQSWPTLAGLRPDERPVIAQVGERIQSRQQAQAAGQGGFVRLDPADRAILMSVAALAGRPVSVQIGDREVATAVNDYNHQAARR